MMIMEVRSHTGNCQSNLSLIAHPALTEYVASSARVLIVATCDTESTITPLLSMSIISVDIDDFEVHTQTIEGAVAFAEKAAAPLLTGCQQPRTVPFISGRISVAPQSQTADFRRPVPAAAAVRQLQHLGGSSSSSSLPSSHHHHPLIDRFTMNKEDNPPTRFAGLTYSRLRSSTAICNVNDAADARTFQLKKAAISVSNWEINFFLVRDSSDGATEPKRLKLESKKEDPFSFKTESKKKSISAVKQDLTAQKHNPHQMSKLPASRIVVKGKGCAEYFKKEKEETCFLRSFCTRFRTASQKPIISDQFVDADKQMAHEQTVFFSEARLEASSESQKRGVDDDFLHVQFKKHSLKIATQPRVDALVDKPDSSPLMKCGSKRKGWPRGRRPLTVNDPELNEQYNINFAAQQLKVKPDAPAKGMNKSTVSLKKELASEAQGAACIVCKPKALVDVHTKCSSRNSKQKRSPVPLASDVAGSQATPHKTGSAESTSSTSANTEAEPTRRSARLQIISALAANSEGTAPFSTKHATRGRHSEISVAASATSSSAGDVSSGCGEKPSQIFKSQAAQMHTAVYNVKQTHKVQELGETQDFLDEFDYLLDNLQDTNPTPVRCLSCLKLAGKCISPAFRKQLRAHGTVTKIFSFLRDACSDPCLALITSAMMFLLSRDSLNMDLDEDSLTLMVRLSKVDTVEHHYFDTSALKEMKKVKQKVLELLTHLPQETNAGEIDLDFVSTGNLAMESLLSLTLKRADEWFKEWSPWGLDRIVDFVTDCEHSLTVDISQDSQKMLPVLKKLNRCLEVLAKISSMNFDSQNYLLSYKNAALVQACTRILRWCQTCMPSYKMLENMEGKKALKHIPGYTILTCMLANLKVLDTVTFENELGNLDLKIETSLMETIVRCLTTHWHVPVEKRFELDLLCLGLLRSLVKHKKSNRQIMMILQTDVKYTEKSQPRTMSAIKAVVELFVQREEAACQMEEDTVEDDKETFTDALNKASRLLDNSAVASYAGLLLGFTVIDNKEYAAAVKKLMPNENFDPVIKRLKTFLNFIRSTAFCSSTVINTITKVIRILQTA